MLCSLIRVGKRGSRTVNWEAGVSLHSEKGSLSKVKYLINHLQPPPDPFWRHRATKMEKKKSLIGFSVELHNTFLLPPQLL